MGLRENLHAHYSSLPFIEVEAPEWPDADGKPSIIRFRQRLTVDDVLALGAFAGKGDNSFKTELFRRLAVDEDGGQLVKPNDDSWFRTELDGLAVVAVANRAKLLEIVYDGIAKDHDGDSGGSSEGK